MIKRASYLEKGIYARTCRISVPFVIYMAYGGMAASMLHYARTVCRRFERRLVAAVRKGAAPG